MMGKNEKPVILFPVDEILPFTDAESKQKRSFTIDGKTFQVKMYSSRFSLFRRNKVCVTCGLEGTLMGLCFAGNETPHFNLYARVDGELVLMTKDHVTPLSKGGKNRQANYQTMCTKCNSIKANYFFEGDELPNLVKLEEEVAEAKAVIEEIKELKILRDIIADRQAKIRGIVVEAKRRERMKRHERAKT